MNQIEYRAGEPSSLLIGVVAEPVDKVWIRLCILSTQVSRTAMTRHGYFSRGSVYAVTTGRPARSYAEPRGARALWMSLSEGRS